MAKQAPERWLESMCVRWAVQSAWTALEMSARDALNVARLAPRFSDRLNDVLQENGFSPVDWGRGLWQDVKQVEGWRHEYAHAGVSLARRFPPVSEASEAIARIRLAILDLYGRVGKTPLPTWVKIDSSPGWPDNRFGATGFLTKQGADPNALDSIRVAVVDLEGREHSDYHSPQTDPDTVAEQAIAHLRSPVQAVRVYRGPDLLLEETLEMRGN
jgi:hypothetical protein